MTYLDPQESFDQFRDRVVTALKEQFPMKGRLQTVELEHVEVDDKLHPEDIRSQQHAKVHGETWAAPVFATVALKETSTGKVIDRRRVRVTEIPKMTNRFSYIVDGQEYQVDSQWQLKPGVYARRKQNGELESQFNIAGRGRFDMLFDPAKKQFVMEYNKSKIPLYPVLKVMGVSDDDLERSWGKDILHANKTAKLGATALERLYKSDTKQTAPSKEVAAQHVHDLFTNAKLRPDVTEITLGKAVDHVSGEALHLASNKLLKVQAGHPEDDRDSLVFKDLRGIGDYVADSLQMAMKGIKKKAERKLNTTTDVRELVRFDHFNAPLKAVFQTSLARVASQINPAEMVSASMQTSIMGPGGIKSDQQITAEAKMVNASHFGFLDPINTPEGDKTGITLRLPMGVRKVGREAKIPLYNLRTGAIDLVGPKEVLTKKVVLPDQVSWEGGKPKPLTNLVKAVGEKNEVEHISMKEADYVLRHPSYLFSVTGNLIPFMGNNSGGRAGMAARHMEQSISLLHRKAPLVQVSTGLPQSGMKTFEEFMGQQASHQSPVDGVVKDIKPDGIQIKDAAGTVHDVQLYHNYPLNDAKGVYHSTPVVEVGAKVKKGQLLADTNFSDKGVLSLGTNLRVAFIPYRGYNFEDGVVISRSAAEKLTSTHLHKPTLVTDDKMSFDVKKFQSQHPGAFTKEQYTNIGPGGLIRVGSKVKPGDPLVVAMKPFELKERTGISAFRKSLSGAHTDRSLRWESDFEGEVVGVHKVGKYLKVHVRTLEPMQIGDKISGRHGNKGIVTSILPDHEMPHTKDGRHIEVALNPSGIPGRMNVGQVLETAAGKIAEKTGKTYIVDNFDHKVPDAVAKVQRELKEHGLTDKEELFDPATGKSLGQALVGPKHLLKLVHQVEKKMAVRSGMGLVGMPGGPGYDVNLMPNKGGHSGGQALGALGVYALLAHGAKANLREMQTFKSEGEDLTHGPMKAWPSQHKAVWEAIQEGRPLPTPKSTFAWQKFEDMLRAAGVNVDKKGHDLILTPMTNQQILHMSAGELTKPSDIVQSKPDKDGTLRPLPGGLFDERVTGGHGGRKWSHIKLAEPVPNPLFETPIQLLTGITSKQFESIVHGMTGVSTSGTLVDPTKGVTGGPGIKMLLERVNVDKSLKDSQAKLVNAKPSLANRLFKKVRYLKALQDIKANPADVYMLHNLPVLPPAMRPLAVLGDGNIKYEDLNGLYKNFALLNDKLKNPTLQKNLTDDLKRPLRLDYYDGVRSLLGAGVPYEHRKEKGLLHLIAGESPKKGYFQAVLTSRRQDLSMRSTIVPEPSLGLDEVGVPKDAALTLFRPFVIRQLIQQGTAQSPLTAQKVLSEVHKGKDNPQVWKALEKVMEQRPVLLKRDPALHKYSIQGFTPKLVEGNAIKIHPLVTGGFNADFDGDSIDLDTPMPLRIEGCVQHLTGRQLIDLLGAGEGNYVVQTRAVEAWTYGGWRPVKTVSFHTVETKKKFRVTLRNGRTVIVSEDHSLMVGGQQARPTELTEGTQLDFHPVVLAASGDSYERGVLYGHFLGDGCAALRPHGGGRVSLACKPHAEREYLMELWRKEFGVHVTREHHGFSVSNVSLAAQFLEECGQYCYGKRVGADLLDRGTEFLRGLLAGHILSDGSVEATRSGSFLIRTWSRSQALQETMSLIASALGLPHSTRVHVAKGQRNYILSFGKEAIKALDYRCVGKKNLLIQQARHEYQTQRKDARKSQSARGFEVLRVEEVEYTERMVDLEVDDVSHVFAILDGVIVHNTMALFVPITHEAIAEARNMFPTKNLFSESSGKAMYQPTLESALGLYKLSVVGKDTKHRFSNETDAIHALEANKIHYSDVVHVGSTKTTAGRVLLAQHLPGPMRTKMLTDFSATINKGGLDKLLTTLAKDHPHDFGATVDHLKNLGNDASYGILKTTFTPKPIAIGTHTLSLEDFQTDRATRDPIVRETAAKVQAMRESTSIPKGDKDRRAVDLWADADRRIKAEHTAKSATTPTNLTTMWQAGVKPGWEQYKQLSLSPMLLKDSSNRTLPTPVTRSYSEGLDVAGYWTATHGARRGAVMKVQEVRDPGYMSKLLQNTAMNLVIDTPDCGTSKGISLSVDSRDVHDRYLAQDFSAGGLHIPAGTMMNPDVVGKIRAVDKNAHVIVRSPLKCEHDKGLCQKCAGAAPYGPAFALGTNLGVMAAHAVGERAVQLPMKEFHVGGVASGGGKVVNNLVRFQHLTLLPQTIPNASTLAMKSGTIEKIEHDATGVTIHIGGHVHHVGKDASGMPLHTTLPMADKNPDFIHWQAPKVGQRVEAGQSLSDPNRTVVNPHHLFKATGSIEKVQNHLTNEIYELYKDEGVLRKNIEVVVKAMSNLTKIHDPGDHPDLLRGQFYPTSVVKRINETELKGKNPIVHTPVLKGIDMMPLEMQEDWIAKLQHLRLTQSLPESAATNAKSSIHGLHPIPGLAYGAEFGLTEEKSKTPGLERLKNVPRHHY